MRALRLIAEVLPARGEAGASEGRLREALPLLQAMGDRPGAALTPARLAEAAARRAEPRLAGRLWGTAEAEQARAPSGTSPAYPDALLAVAGPEFEAGRAAGRRLELADAIEEALSRA